MFPAHQQGQIRTQLSQVLEGIICQLLVPTVGGTGRAAVTEVLMVSPAIRHLIREDKPHQIYSAMQAGQGKLGMQTMNQSLAALYQEQRITLRQALAHSSNRDELQEMIKRGAGGASGGGSWQQASRSGAPARVRARPNDRAVRS